MSDLSSSFGALLPEQFGKYALLGHLATGGMAEVWLARQLGIQGFEKIVVIKRARPELSDEETTQFFLDEARLVATLEHPNIAQVYEIGRVDNSYFIVMEYLPGADLRQVLDRAAAKAKAAGVDCATAHVIAAAPWEAILAAAKKGKCDAIVMASHGRRGISALLLGSETMKVLTHGKVPVIVVR